MEKRENYGKIKSALKELILAEKEMTKLLLKETSPQNIDLEGARSALSHLKEFEELEKSEPRAFDVISKNLPEKAPGFFGRSEFKKRIRKTVPYMRYLVHVGELFSRSLKPDLKPEDIERMKKIIEDFEEDRKEFFEHLQEVRKRELYHLGTDEKKTLWFRNYDPRFRSLMGRLENFEQIFPEIRFEEEHANLRSMANIIKRHGPDTYWPFDLSTLLEYLENIYGIERRLFLKIGEMYGIEIEKPEMVMPVEEKPEEKKVIEKVEEKPKEVAAKPEEVEKKEELKEPVIGYSIPVEKLMALEIFRLGYKGWLEKTKLGVFLPLLKKAGGYIESTGNPENIGSELIALHSLFEKAGASYDMTLEDIVKFKPELGRYVDDLRKLISSAITYFEE